MDACMDREIEGKGGREGRLEKEEIGRWEEK